MCYVKMAETENISKDLSLTRRELKNIRQEVMKLRANVKNEAEKIMLFLTELNCKQEKKGENNIFKGQSEVGYKMIPIGTISSCFKNKNGIPRQPSLCQSAKASLKIDKTFFTNPEHSLIGLSEFSHIWILFVFNKNTESSKKAKVHPPRLNGKSVGVFSTRSPHRPCAIGLSLVKLDKIIDSTLFLSGVDMLDGTPVLDIKPYIPSYDIPKLCKNIENSSLDRSLVEAEKGKIAVESSNCCTLLNSNPIEKDFNIEDKGCNKTIDENLSVDSSAKSIHALLKMPPTQLKVIFTERAERDIEKFHAPIHEKCDYCLNFISDLPAAKQAIIDILHNDPRSVYRRNKCSDKLYFFEVDKIHITCWFDDTIAEVLRIKPVPGT